MGETRLATLGTESGAQARNGIEQVVRPIQQIEDGETNGSDNKPAEQACGLDGGLNDGGGIFHSARFLVFSHEKGHRAADRKRLCSGFPKLQRSEAAVFHKPGHQLHQALSFEFGLGAGHVALNGSPADAQVLRDG